MANTNELKAALQAKYSDNAYALVFEVADGTGSAKSRSADAMAFSLWPSRGLTITGFELKVSRTDWQKELSQPAKAEAICRYCDYWFIVAGDKSIVRDGELPPTWGLMVLSGKGLVTQVPAPQLTSQPIDRAFLMGLIRSAQKPAARENQSILAKEFERGRLSGVNSTNWTIDNLTKKLVEREKLIRDFEEAAGFSIHKTWDHSPSDVGRIVKDVLSGQHRRDIDEVKRIHRLASDIVARIDESNVLLELQEQL